ncbi:MAG: hypothetical protein ACK4K7_14850 [Allosphingosinicella sp.]|uniref:hypothetical protein n=1 Tax=Allosphingosinicella sp. TaxID=2823234 RepID=UPI00393E4B60
MEIRSSWRRLERNPLVRNLLFALGCLLLIAAPVVGVLPGPGGIVFFGLGLGLVLKYSDWAKRLYVRFKKRHPNKGRWADWGLRRPSARRREALRGGKSAAERPGGD